LTASLSACVATGIAAATANAVAAIIAGHDALCFDLVSCIRYFLSTGLLASCLVSC